MKFNDYIFEDLKLHKWKLNSSYSFDKNKVTKIEIKKFTKDEISFLFSMSSAFGLNFEEKDSLKIYNFFVDKNLIQIDKLSEFMLDSKARKNVWKGKL
tara:strand:- start:37 stop:330 length:294 start_codon:yes stop_codon:yes gene_type:complete